MKAHVEYSQILAVEFSHLIKDYEELVEDPEDIVIKAQEEVDLEAVCAVFEKLMENEPITVLRALRPNVVDEDVMAAVERSNEELVTNNLVEEIHPLCGEELVKRRSMRIKKPQLPVSSETVKSLQFSVDNNCHKLVKSKKKKFKCSMCGKGFSEKGSRNIHARIHTGEKPFECTICCKRFYQKYNLKIHTSVHTGEKLFKCSICGKGFSLRDSLKKHNKIHTAKNNE